jgi:hypothetical protein
MLGCLTVYGALFGTGSYLYGHYGTALFWGVVFVISGTLLTRIVRQLWSSAPAS